MPVKIITPEMAKEVIRLTPDETFKKVPTYSGAKYRFVRFRGHDDKDLDYDISEIWRDGTPDDVKTLISGVFGFNHYREDSGIYEYDPETGNREFRSHDYYEQEALDWRYDGTGDSWDVKYEKEKDLARRWKNVASLWNRRRTDIYKKDGSHQKKKEAEEKERQRKAKKVYEIALQEARDLRDALDEWIVILECGNANRENIANIQGPLHKMMDTNAGLGTVIGRYNKKQRGRDGKVKTR